LLPILVAGEGLYAIYAILGSVLNAAGKFHKTAAITGFSLVPAFLIIVILIHFWGAVGAALAGTLIPFCGVLIFKMMIWRQFRIPLPRRSLYNIGLAGSLMFLVDAMLPEAAGIFVLLPMVSLGVYVASLVILGEITRKDFIFLVPRQEM
jgi:O-antigen/teichoic acid export membrane protein